MKQKSVAVRATNTTYVFEDAGVEITLTFTNPNLPDDLMLLARPATYLTWRVRATDGKEHDVKLYFDATAELCVNEDEQLVVGARETTDALDVLSLGTRDQNVLGRSGDNLRIDWGRLYVAAEKGARRVPQRRFPPRQGRLRLSASRQPEMARRRLCVRLRRGRRRIRD